MQSRAVGDKNKIVGRRIEALIERFQQTTD